MASKNKMKANRHEREIADFLSSHFPNARRGLQGQGERETGISDVVNTGKLHVECKTSIHHPRVNEAWVQASAAAAPFGKVPVLFLKYESKERTHPRHVVMEYAQVEQALSSLDRDAWPFVELHEVSGPSAAHWYKWMLDLEKCCGTKCMIRVIIGGNRDLAMMPQVIGKLVIAQGLGAGMWSGDVAPSAPKSARSAAFDLLTKKGGA